MDNIIQPTENRIPRNKLRYLRDRSRLSLNEVSILTGIDYTTISKHEGSTRGLSAENIAKYARVYKVETHELFYLDGEIEVPESEYDEELGS